MQPESEPEIMSHIWGSWRRGRIPISQPKFWLNPIVPEHKSHHLSGCPAQILIPFPFSIVFLLMNPSPSAWNPIFPPKNKQIPVPILPLHDPHIFETVRLYFFANGIIRTVCLVYISALLAGKVTWVIVNDLYSAWVEQNYLKGQCHQFLTKKSFIQSLTCEFENKHYK
jgi:hypothetical protein